MALKEEEFLIKLYQKHTFFFLFFPTIFSKIYITSSKPVKHEQYYTLPYLVRGLNVELSFSYTGCPTKAKETSLPYYFFGKKQWIYAFPEGIKWEQWLIQNLNLAWWFPFTC